MRLLSKPFLNNCNHLLSSLLIFTQFTVRFLQHSFTQRRLKRFFRHCHSSVIIAMHLLRNQSSRVKSDNRTAAGGREYNKMKPHNSLTVVYFSDPNCRLGSFLFCCTRGRPVSMLLYMLEHKHRHSGIECKSIPRHLKPKAARKSTTKTKVLHTSALLHITSVLFLQDESRSTQFLFLCFPFFFGGEKNFHVFTIYTAF